MVRIEPFIGLRYNPEHIQDIEQVVAPPYDVISPQEQAALHQKHPQNIVRLILGQTTPDDSDANNVYTRAHDALTQWKATKAVTPELSPAVYAYSQTWQGVERKGIIARMRIEDYDSGQVLPHEYTLGGPKADRLALTKATECLLSPIFCLYDDPSMLLENTLFNTPTAEKALFSVTDKDGVHHQFWPVTSPEIIESLQTMLANKPALIADGHHRYETAMAYRNWRREQAHQENTPIGELPWDFTMAFFTNMADSGLRVYPTHRVFSSLPEGWTQDSLIQALTQYFIPTNSPEALFWVESKTHPKQGYVLKPGTDCSGIPKPLQKLDVALIDHFVFQSLLKQPANALKQEGFLHFVRDEQEVALDIAAGALVFWVHAPDVAMVRDICASGERMPQKSTYFYPKLLSGLVIYDYTLQQTSSGGAIGGAVISSISATTP